MVSAGDTLRAACARVERALAAADCPDAAFDAADLCLLVTGMQPRTAPAQRCLSAAEAQQLNAVAARRANREPLQYIWGHWPFLNFALAVGEGVLCPRADTEIVTELAAQCLCPHAGNPVSAAQMPLVAGAAPVQVDVPTVLELCGGSGCIGLGIKMFCPSAQVTILEKSPLALPYLRQNAAHALADLLPHHPAPYVQVVEGDLFDYHTTLPDAAFDLLVSNPPYLTELEMTQLQPEVAQEPAMALVAGADGLDFYRAIAADYKRVVKQGGYLALEIGCTQAAAVTALLAAAGWANITCHKDYGHNDRCIIAQRLA